MRVSRLQRWVGFAALALAATGCFSLELPQPPVLGPGTVRATLVTALPGRAEPVPAVGAVVTLRGTTQSATADADGNVLLTGLTATTGTLLFTHDSDADGVVDRARVVTLEAARAGFGKDVNLGTLSLGRLATVSGKALRGDREALPSGHGGISVFLPEGPQLAYTGDDGSYVLGGVPEGDVILSVFATGYRSEATSLTTRPGEELRVSALVLKPDPGGPAVGQLSGLVQQVDGTPIAAAAVRAASQGQEFAAQTNAEGRFTFATLPTGVYALAIEKAGFASLRADGVLVQAGLNEAGPFVLTAGSGGPIDLDGGSRPPDGGAGGGSGADAGGGAGGGGGAGTDGGGGGSGADAGGGGGGSDAGVDGGEPDAGPPDAGSPPVALVGPDQLIIPGRPVTLDGMASTGEHPLTYGWNQLTGPQVTLSSNGTAMSHSPSFTAPSPAGQVLEFSLIVKDRFGRSSAPAFTRVAIGRPPVAAFVPDAGLFYGGQQLVLTSTSTDIDMLALVQHEWTLLAGSGGTLVADGGPQALFTLPSVAYLAPDVLAGVQLRVTNSVGGTSAPAQRVYTVRGASPDNWTIDAGPTLTVDVGATPVAQSLGVGFSSVIPSPPTPTFSWTCDGGLALVGATTANPSFLPTEVQGAPRAVTCQVQATGPAPLQPMVVSTSKQVILRDVRPPAVTFSQSDSRLSPFGFLTQFSEPINASASGFSGTCTPGASFDRHTIGRWLIAEPLTELTDGTSCTALTLTVADLATPQNQAFLSALPGTTAVQRLWEGPFVSTQDFTDPRPVVATLGPLPRYQQERFQAPMPFAPAFEILSTEGADLHRITGINPFGPSSCSPTCPVMSTPVTFPGLATNVSPVGHRANYSGAELFVGVQESTDGGVAPTLARRSAGGGWTRFDGATGAPYMRGTDGLRTVRVDSGQVLVDTHDPALDQFTTTDLVATGVTDAVLLTGVDDYVAAVRGPTRQLAAWSKGTLAWSPKTHTMPANVQALKAVTFGSVTGAVYQRSTTSQLWLARLDTGTSERQISTTTVKGFDAAGWGGVLYVVYSENGDVLLESLSTSAYAGGWAPVAVDGPPRSGFMPPYPLALDANPLCEAAWPRLAFIETALVITWQERCSPATQWKVMTRVIR